MFYGKTKYKISFIIAIALLLQMLAPALPHYSFADKAGAEGLKESMKLLSTTDESSTVTSDVYSEPEEFQFITKVALTDENGKPFEGSIKKDSKIRITYYYEIPDEFKVDVNDLYTLTIPNEINIIKDMKILLPETGDLMATVDIYTNNSVMIKFAEDINDFYDRWGEFYVYTEFDKEKIGDGGETDIVFDLGGGSTQTITVEFEKVVETVDVNLEKSGKYDTDKNEITWTIKVKPQTTPNLRPVSNVVITDVIQEGQNYVAESAKITPAIAEGKFEWNEDSKTLTYKFNEDINIIENEEYTIAFKSKPDILAFDSEGKKLYFKNKSESTFDGGTSESNEVTLETTVDFINKSGKYNSATKKIDWTVIINTNNLKITNAKIKDQLPNTKKDFPLELDIESIKLDGEKISISPEGPLTYDGFFLEYSFEEINKKHTLTYSTEVVDPDAYNSNTSKMYENNVDLEGDGVPGNATDKEKVGVPTSVIKKEGVDYNASTREITWRIIVNSNKIEITNPVVSDEILAGLEYVSNSFEVEGISTNKGFIYTPAAEEDTNKTGTFIYNFEEYKVSDKINQTYILTFKTKVLDNNIWANNADKIFYNTVKLTGTGIPTSTSQGNRKVISKVIEKKGVDYNHLTREATWTIEVNQNNMPMTNAYVIDKIDEYQKFVPESVTINGTLAEEGTEFEKNKYYFDKNTKTLRYNFPEEIKDIQTITFRTVIPEDKLDIFYENGNKILSNTATLYGDEMPENGVSSTGTNTIKNTVVSKTGKYKSGNSFIDWEVVINQNQLPIANAILEDTLQEGLELDTSSIKLYKLNILANGSYKEGEEIKLNASNVKYDAETRKFEFCFTEDIKEAYILKFRTDIADAYSNATFTNTISFKGSSRSTTSTSEEITVSFQTGGGDAGGTTRGSITVIKIDDILTKLKGAIFELLDMFKNVLKTSEATSDNGEALFKGLKYDTTYYIREKASPKGYALSNEIYEFQVKNEDAKKDIKYEFVNTKIKGNIEFIKLNEDGEYLEGAEFSLYNADDEDLISIATSTSDIDGKVAFKGIAFGSYKIIETKAPEGYIESEQVLIATIDEDGVTVKANPESISNTKIKGHFELTKTDISTSKPLPNAKIAIYTEYDALVEEKMTDENGIVKFENLSYGKYYFKETQAPAGYMRNNEKHPFEIKEDGNVVKDILENERKTVPVDPEPPTKPEKPEEPEKPTEPPTKPEEPEKPTEPEPEPEPKPEPEPEKPTIVTPPENGTVEFDEDGNWKYTPNPGFKGKDKFVIRHPDGTEELIEIDVDDIPLGTVLPKTGEGSKIGYYITGLLLVFLGLFLRRKIV